MHDLFNLIYEYFVSFEFIQIEDTLKTIVDTMRSVPESHVAEADISMDNISQPNKFLTVLDIVMKGGWLMIPLLLLSIYSIYVFVERYLTIKKASSIDPEFMLNMRDYLYNGNMNAAKNLCRNSFSPIAKMIEKGLSKVGKPHTEIDHAIESVGKLELYKLENKMGALATISGVAPMIGFLGTVLGMIRAFFNLSHSGSNIDPTMLAGGIYEALVTTAAGLLIGICAYWFYNMLVNMVEKVVFQMEVMSIDFIDSLPENS